VLSAFLVDPTEELSGVEVCAAAAAPIGSLHHVLARLEGMGWVESRWEDPGARSEGRPSRRYYRLTGIGADLARRSLAEARHPSARLRYRPAAGQP
jgi:PadR family transcriptional regulator